MKSFTKEKRPSLLLTDDFTSLFICSTTFYWKQFTHHFSIKSMMSQYEPEDLMCVEFMY